MHTSEIGNLFNSPSIMLFWILEDFHRCADIYHVNAILEQAQGNPCSPCGKPGTTLMPHGVEQGFPTGGTRTPKGYEIEHQGVRKSLGHRAAYISLIEQYISQIFFGY